MKDKSEEIQNVTQTRRWKIQKINKGEIFKRKHKIPSKEYQVSVTKM